MGAKKVSHVTLLLTWKSHGPRWRKSGDSDLQCTDNIPKG